MTTGAISLTRIQQESGRLSAINNPGEISGSTVIEIKSDKTLLGLGKTAHLRGIELAINQARNVIIRNVTLSHVLDAGETNEAITTRMGACVGGKNNFFENVKKVLFADYCGMEGFVQLDGNHFSSASFIVSPLCE